YPTDLPGEVVPADAYGLGYALAQLVDQDSHLLQAAARGCDDAYPAAAYLAHETDGQAVDHGRPRARTHHEQPLLVGDALELQLLILVHVAEYEEVHIICQRCARLRPRIFAGQGDGADVCLGERLLDRCEAAVFELGGCALRRRLAGGGLPDL